MPARNAAVSLGRVDGTTYSAEALLHQAQRRARAAVHQRRRRTGASAFGLCARASPLLSAHVPLAVLQGCGALRPCCAPPAGAARRSLARCELHMSVPLCVLTVVAVAGPVTVVLERVPGALSAELNPGVERIGAIQGPCTSSYSVLSRVARRHPRAGQRFHTLNCSSVWRGTRAYERQRQWRNEHACCE